jgi:hypothetical protein
LATTHIASYELPQVWFGAVERTAEHARSSKLAV